MNPWAHKFDEPTAAQILWAQSPQNFIYAPKAL